MVKSRYILLSQPAVTKESLGLNYSNYQFTLVACHQIYQSKITQVQFFVYIILYIDSDKLSKTRLTVLESIYLL